MPSDSGASGRPSLPHDSGHGGNSQDSGLAALVVVLGFLQIAADQPQLRHSLGHTDPASAGDLVRLAKRLGAKAKLAKLSPAKVGRAPVPLVAEASDGSFFVIGAVREGEALIQSPGGTIEQLSLSELGERWTGKAVLLTTRANEVRQGRRFDVSWFVPALLRYRWILSDVLVASLVLQLFALATPLFFQVVIDKVLVHQGLTTLDVLIIGLTAIILFETLLGGLRSHIFVHTTSRVDVELGAKLYRHLLALPLAYFEQRRVGDSVARVRELETIREFLTSSALTLTIDLLFTVIFLAVMWFYSPYLFAIVAASIVLYAIISFVITPPLKRRIDERFDRGAESQAFLVESVTGVQTLKAAAVEPQMQNRWEILLAGYVRSGFRAAKLSIWGGQAIQLVNKLSMALILYVGAKLALSGQMTIGELVAFNMLAGRVSEPVLRLAHLWQQFQEARVGVQRLGDILNTPTETEHRPSRSALPEIAGRVTYDHVSFRYAPGGRQILHDVSLDITPGEIVGIVGPSGSGKSTLTKLLQRLYVPESGRVMVDGVDLALVDPAWLRRQLGVVLQENLLFNRSVRENIALSDSAAPMDLVIAAAQLAGAHDFILELPEGYDTVIEERGANLSGGQRQRIAIARALISDPRILIFDEATSSLDAESEEIIQRNLSAMADGRTVIIIAHRLSALRQASRIVTLEGGRVVEIGSHEELIARNGRYASLWRAQMGGRAQ
ncbi:MAG: type I secretion system permease/ATPase [Micropepsaceae bacterium]